MVGIFQFAMLVITRWYISLGEKSPFSHGQFDLAMASFFNPRQALGDEGG